MKTNLIRAVAALALIAPFGMVQAQEVQFASHTELNNLYARLAELESRVAASNVSGGCGCTDAVGNGCGNGCDDGCDDCCGCAGVVAGAEILWLKAFNSGNDFGDFNYDEGFRWWVGYQGSGGLGVRLRGFEYQQAAANGDVVDINSFDAEVYDAIQVGCNWDLYIGGGVRYLDYLTIDTGGAGLDDITGVGPVVTAELYRHVSDRAALYAIGRQSIVAGDGNTNGAAAEDLTNYVTELQLGLQVHRDYGAGRLFARAGWEAQWYHEPNANDESVTLMGGLLGAGFMR
jgi:hypothetical protein